MVYLGPSRVVRATAPTARCAYDHPGRPFGHFRQTFSQRTNIHSLLTGKSSTVCPAKPTVFGLSCWTMQTAKPNHGRPSGRPNGTEVRLGICRPIDARILRPVLGAVSSYVFARAWPLVAHSVGAQRAAPIFLRVPTSGARGLAAFAEPRGPLPDSGLVSCVRPDIG
jgi:hypothetical protein